jgi:hypothetical protein
MDARPPEEPGVGPEAPLVREVLHCLAPRGDPGNTRLIAGARFRADQRSDSEPGGSAERLLEEESSLLSSLISSASASLEAWRLISVSPRLRFDELALRDCDCDWLGLELISSLERRFDWDCGIVSEDEDDEASRFSSLLVCDGRWACCDETFWFWFCWPERCWFCTDLSLLEEGLLEAMMSYSL